MAWSLFNALIAEQVNALLDEAGKDYGPEVERFMSRDQAASVIHAALWAHGSRASSTAGVYAMMNLFEAIGLKNWTFDADEADAFNAVRASRQRAALAE